MNAVSGIFMALSLIFGGGYALNKIYLTTKKAAVERVQRVRAALVFSAFGAIMQVTTALWGNSTIRLQTLRPPHIPVSPWIFFTTVIYAR